MILKGILNAVATTLLVTVLLFVQLGATTIQPYPNLGELAKSSETMVIAKVLKNYEYQDGNTTYLRSKVIVQESFKGALNEGEQFDIQKWERIVDGTELVIWGDTELYEETTYLMFLHQKANGTYEPICFSYYLFEEITRYGETYLVPSEHAKEFELAENQSFETLKVYKKAALVTELQQVVAERKTWESKAIEADLTLNDFYPYRLRRSGPDHCSYLTSGGVAMRWDNFDTPVSISYVQDASPACDQANSLVQACVTSLNTSYPGVDLRDGGSVAPVADCGNFTAVGYNYRNWIDANLGSDRNIIVQYEDPCNEFPALDGCSGVVAIGGLYKTGTHEHGGETWSTGAYGYVVLNEGAAGCFCGDTRLTDILEHELSHALGLGHISNAAGAANMNPGCCNDISNLDQTCVDHSYPSAFLLPVEMTSFSGRVADLSNVLEWETAQEFEIDHYLIERADAHAPTHFEVIGSMDSRGDSETGHSYTFEDADPNSRSYYRIRALDYSGEETPSGIITLQREALAKAVVYPTQVKDQVFIRLPETTEAQYVISSTTGEVVQTASMSQELTAIDLAHLSSGWYYVRVAHDQDQQAFKILKQ